jgi:NAD(P)-dependent dehydrogenase (short-subunit alcohol dehydrogenase family)
MTAHAALLVLGATGAIGRGVVRAAVEAGRPVIAVSSDRDGLREMQGTHAHADLFTLVANVDNERRAAALAAKLRKLDRPIDGVVAALCNKDARGRLLDESADTLGEVLDGHVVAHLAAARHLLPLLAQRGRGGGYILIDGPGGERPWAGYGHRSVGAAALRMLARVLHDEARVLGVRLQMLSLDWPVRTDDNAAHACAQWPSANGIGRRVLALIDRRDRAPTQAVITCTGPCADDDAPQAADSDAALLTARCLQDARKLLGSLRATLAPSPSPSTPSSPSKEDTHDRPNRR